MFYEIELIPNSEFTGLTASLVYLYRCLETKCILQCQGEEGCTRPGWS